MLISLRTLRTKHLPDVSERFIADLARRREIPAVRLGGRWMFDPDAVLASLKARGLGASGSPCVDPATASPGSTDVSTKDAE